MNQPNKKINFDKTINDSSSENYLEKKISSSEKIKLKNILMDKYNLSEKEAEKQLIKIENRILKENQNKPPKTHVHKRNIAQKKFNTTNIIKKDKTKEANPTPKKQRNITVKDTVPIQNTVDKQNTTNATPLKEKSNETYKPMQNKKEEPHQMPKKQKSKIKNKLPLQNIINKQNTKPKKQRNITVKDTVPIQNTVDKQNTANTTPLKEKSNETTNHDVDSILTEIIPNYNEHISIELENVNLTFESELDKVDTIKEGFIRKLKGVKNEKRRIHALNDISFKIYEGEKIGIIGYNGAGKSTLLNVICGIYPPDTGTVKTEGRISPLLGLGAGFDHNYSGSRNIFLNAAVLGYDKEYIESKYDEIVEFSELDEYIHLPIKNYSKGMLTKLGFSIATIVEPDILIIDEILGVGDVNFRKKSKDKMKSLMDGGTTVLLVSHSIPQIRDICDKAIWIDNGKIREIGEVNKVCDMYIKDSENASKKQLANIQLVNE